MGDTATTLNQAYQRIEQGELAQARNLLQPLLTTDANNADVWWLYTHAAEDPLEGQRALDRVLALRPDYPGASDLRQQMSGDASAKPGVKPLQRPATTPASTAENEFDEEFDGIEAGQPSRRSPVVWALIVVVVLGVAAVFALFLSQALQPTPPTEVANATGQTVQLTDEPLTTPEVILPFATDEVVPTIATEEIVATEPDIPTATNTVRPRSTPTEEALETTEVVEATPTQEIVASATTAQTGVEPSPTASVSGATATTIGVTAQSAAGGTEALDAELVSASIAFDSIGTKPTRLGNTLVVSVCGVPGPDASRVLASIMNIMVKHIGSYAPGVEALGVSIADCSQAGDGRIVAVPMGTAGAYARNEIDLRVFQSLWQPVE